MTDLFGSDTKSGYRLHALEVLNWGCFDGRPVRLEFDGESAVFMGANSSGKSTMVDAIQTMLIPNTLRAYNSSADTKATPRRKESYVLGATGNITDEETRAVVRKNLRKKEDVVTILSICFRDASAGIYSTHIIFCSFSGDELKENIFTASREVRLSELHETLKDINIKSGGELKGAMKKAGFTYFDSYDRYQKDFQKRFGIDITGLKLLKECIGSKDLGSLNITEFVRKYIIDDISLAASDDQGGKSIAEAYQSAADAVGSLSGMQKELEKADRQNKALEEVIRTGEQRAEAKKRLETLRDSSDVLENWYTDTAAEALSDEVKKEEGAIEVLSNSIENELKPALAEKRRTLDRLNADEVVRAIEDKRAEKRRIESALHVAAEKRRRYEECIQTVNRTRRSVFNSEKDSCSLPENEESFIRIRDRVTARLIEWCDEEEAEREEDRRKPEKAKADCIEDKEKLEEEYDFLCRHKTNIPLVYDRARNAIADALGIKPAELPFAGELMQVKPSESMWERAVEDVFAPLSLTLLIRSRYLKKAEEFLNNERNRSRFGIDITLLNIDSVLGFKKEEDDDSLVYNKVEFREHGYAENLKAYIVNTYSYSCVTSLKEASGSQYVLPSGFYKDTMQETKREAVMNLRYLGWENEKRKIEIQQELESVKDEIAELENRIAVCNTKIMGARTIRKACQTLQENYPDWSDIDVFTLRDRSEEIADEIAALEKANREKGCILEKIHQLEEEIAELEKTKSAMDKAIGGSDQRKADCIRQLKEIEKRPRWETTDEMKAVFNATYSNRLKTGSYEEVYGCYKALRSEIYESLNKAMEDIKSSTRAFNSQIENYLHPKVKDGELSWELEVEGFLPGRIDDNEDGEDVLEAYRAHYEKVKGGRVESSEAKFTEYFLNFVRTISLIISRIDTAKKVVRRVIEEVNEPLRKIAYDRKQGTHLEIITNENADADCRKFKSDLGKLTVDTGLLVRDDDFGRVLSEFRKLEAFFRKYEESPAVLRKVLDIRSYFTFYCREEYENGSEYKVHKDVDALSGGEKAQLTYTILGAALTYHLTLNSGAGPFRLLVLDEAFSKLDPDKSEYAMKLFEELGFQLIVVTPDAKYSLLKRYVKNFFHFKKAADGRSGVFKVSIDDVEGA